MSRTYLPILFTCALAALAAPGPDPIATVTGGQIEGRANASGAMFRGIPYAAPPVGDLRWKEPMPVKPWTGVRDAIDYGATCAQMDAGWNKLDAQNGSEDCLFLNIWTNEWPPKTPKPVMVWIHGGANMGGSAGSGVGSRALFDGTRIASHGVVLVTLNYRLGLLGFFAHPELTAESPHHASGNYGTPTTCSAVAR